MLARVTEATVVVYCCVAIWRRYSRRSVKIVPGDALLWTLVMFFVVPLVLDVIGVLPIYKAFPGLAEPRTDPLVRGVAAVGTLIAVVMTVVTIRRAEKRERQVPPLLMRRRVRRRWLVGSFLPLFVVALSPMPDAYRTFAAPFVLRGIGQPFHDPAGAVAHFGVFVAWSTYLSCVAFAVWFSTGPRTRWGWATGAAVLYMDLWLNGKRHIVAMFVIVVLFAVASRTELTRKQVRRGMALGLVGLVGVLGLSAWYQATFRPHVAEADDQLESFIIDFGRQDVLRLAIAGHINADVPRPLDYAGQSVILDVKAAVPGFVDQDSITYADRVTSVAYGESVRQQPGAITTSLISEAVDNFGLVGLLIGPALLCVVALVGSYRNDPLLRIVGALAAATLAVVHVLAVVSIVGLVVARIGWLTFRRFKAKGRSYRLPYSLAGI